MNNVLNYSRLVMLEDKKDTKILGKAKDVSKCPEYVLIGDILHHQTYISGICYVGKETKILGDAEDVLEEEDAEISFPGSLVSDCLPVLHENFSTFSQTKKKIYSIVVICYSIEREK